MKTIRPDLLAGKIESAQFQKHLAALPSIHPAALREMLWCIQAAGMGNRGLDALVETLVSDYPECFITQAMHAAGAPKEGRYSLAQCLEIWKDETSRNFLLHLAARSEEDACQKLAAAAMHEMAHGAETDAPGYQPKSFDEWLARYIDGNITPKAVERGIDYDRAAILKGAEHFNFAFLNAECIAAARQKLATLLVDWCVEKTTSFNSPTYCHDLPALLLRHMEVSAARQRGRIAETQITKIVFRELDFALSQSVPVPIIGESRIGKTSPASAWCDTRPGRARLVTVPETNRIRDFIEAHADAFGIEYTRATTTAALTADVKYATKHSGIFICYDESQGLIPANYHKTTPPCRLNFVRFNVIDTGVGCAFFATPQSHKQTLDQYVKTTGYRIEQWLGRLAPPVILPADLGREDLLAVARLHFPHVPEPFLKLIAARAMTCEGYIKMMDITAKRALFIGQESGRAVPILIDVQQAIADMMPSAQPSIVAAAPVSTARNRRPEPPTAPDPAPGVPTRATRPAPAAPITRAKNDLLIPA